MARTLQSLTQAEYNVRYSKVLCLRKWWTECFQVWTTIKQLEDVSSVSHGTEEYLQRRHIVKIIILSSDIHRISKGRGDKRKNQDDQDRSDRTYFPNDILMTTCCDTRIMS